MEIIAGCERVYLESYTSILADSSRLSKVLGKELIVADREMVESASDEILKNANQVDVAFLVVGDPFGATTHADLLLRADELSIPTQALHNASILTAVGQTGLQLYRFGQTVSIPWFEGGWRPDSWYDRIKENKKLGLHTLVLLDIKVKEPSFENMARGKMIYEPPRFMTVAQAIEQMLEIEQERGDGVLSENAMGVACCRMGCPTQLILTGPLGKLMLDDRMIHGEPLHSLVIPGDLHCMEDQMIQRFQLDSDAGER